MGLDAEDDIDAVQALIAKRISRIGTSPGVEEARSNSLSSEWSGDEGNHQVCDFTHVSRFRAYVVG
jgi:hypothetical protein